MIEVHMKLFSDIVRESHDVVWAARAELQHVWPTPGRLDSLRFAHTETGEAMDAYMRTMPQYSRNRDRNLDELNEWADVAMMVLTALGPDWSAVAVHEDSPYWRRVGSAHDTWRESICWGTAEALNGVARGVWKPEWLIAVLVRIADIPEMDLPARLTSRLARIRARVLPAPQPVTVTDYEPDISPLE